MKSRFMDKPAGIGAPPKCVETAELTDYDGIQGKAPGKTLTPAAKRALEEAAARHAAAAELQRAPEDGGPAGLEPTRFGDWERKGLAVDF